MELSRGRLAIFGIWWMALPFITKLSIIEDIGISGGILFYIGTTLIMIAMCLKKKGEKF